METKTLRQLKQQIENSPPRGRNSDVLTLISAILLETESLQRQIESIKIDMKAYR